LGSILLVVLTFYFLGRLVDARASFGRNGYFAYAIPGIATAGLLVGVVRAHAASVRTSQTAGTLETMLMTPTRPWEIAFGSSLSLIGHEVVRALCYVALAAVLGAPLLGARLFWLPLVLAVSLLSFVPFGLVGAAWVVILKRGDPVTYAVNSATMLLAGVYFPLSVLPEWMQRCGQLFPPMYAVAAMRTVMLGTGSPLGSLVPLAAFSIVALPLSAWALERAISHAKRRGTLGQA
jgi:ABC-2 type transport system permease protein